MSDRTAIEWTDATWNPIRGCSRVSEGCRNCYAERQAIRFAGPGQPYEGLVRSTVHGPRWTGRVRLVHELVDAPLRWRNPRRIFVNSMSDLFHPQVPFEFIDKIWLTMSLTPRHTYQILTKRPDRMLEVVQRLAPRHTRRDGTGWPLPNVWLGVSVEDQWAADERIPLLLQTPAAVRWVSCEPLLGPVDLRLGPEPPCSHRGCYNHVSHPCEGCGRKQGRLPIDWVVVGGESGPGARPMHPDWVRSIRDQCQAAGVAFFFKTWGEWVPTWGDETHLLFADGQLQPGTHDDPAAWRDKIAVPVRRVSRRKAGALLDGREWREWPVVAAR